MSFLPENVRKAPPVPILKLPAPEPPPPPRPIVKWVGGKRGILDQLVELFPARHGTYFEPFLGGAAVFLRAAPPHSCLGDANPDLAQLYQTVRDEPVALMQALDAMQPHVLDEEYYYAQRALPSASLPSPARAARFIYLNKTCYNGLYRVNRKGQFNVPFGRYTEPPRLYDADNIRRVARVLAGARLVHGDFEETLAEAGPGDFVYLDPPYVPLTASANFTKYTADAFGPADQERLARCYRALSERGCKLLLSNSDTPEVKRLYAGFNIRVVWAPRNINSDVGGRKRIAELAVRNYDT